MKQPEFISLLALIHAPEMFEGHPVRVVGLCSFIGKSSAMWAATEYYNQSITRNAVGLDVAPDDALVQMHGKVMLVEGVFTLDPAVMSGAYSGTLVNLSRLETWGDDA